MIGNYIDDEAHTQFLQALSEYRELLLRPDLGIEASVIGDVVSMHAAGMSHQKWGGVTVGDPQIMQVRNHSGCLSKGKTQIELEAIS